MSTLKLGSRIKKFRKRSGYSQFDLENNIDLSPGSISRIETGLVNPTKETIFLIAKALELNQKDTSELLGIPQVQITVKDIDRAKSHIHDYFIKPDAFAILMDIKGNILDVSEGMFTLFSVPRSMMENLIGINMLKLLYTVNPISKLLQVTDDMLKSEISIFKERTQGMENDIWYKELIGELINIPKFKDDWDGYDVNYVPYTTNQRSREIRIEFEGQTITIIPSFYYLPIDPRFEIVDYIIKLENE
ncbi:helix-turn-helix transcriptional regulator [Candidatus Dojkabacteria bacterium]|uniref:Helix-turn-helix transcriptional regulator n=1 Tax=Candidatus Dojkabacteria bacterium TaxID=2099670 RepID=A0A955LB91_9BACT|nr:helix-turn-helix transcriptional regulator [Candidatus Dojkabacteria bacterium]